MRTQEARILGDRICDFLERQGGAYAGMPPEVVFNVFWSLGTGDYVLRETDGEIDFFACYWRIRPEDVPNVVQRIKPSDITSGTVMYVAEAASRVGLADVVKALRKQAVGMRGLFWHRPTKQDKVYQFPSQGGGEE